MLELFIIALYTPARIDRRFHVPDGSSKRRNYAEPSVKERSDQEDEVKSLEKRDSALGSIA